ncbi:MAG TPA: ester cyclase, partial [Gemmatimonadales bacterium]|nr:ester cyclase [Gemmatimonadales bacterium]
MTSPVLSLRITDRLRLAGATLTTVQGISAVMSRVQDGYDRRDAAALAALHSHDCVVDSPIAGVHVGRAAIERTLRTVFSAFPDLRIRKEDLLVAGNRAVWTLTIEGTDTGGFMGLPPTGKPFRLSALFMFTFGN